MTLAIETRGDAVLQRFRAVAESTWPSSGTFYGFLGPTAREVDYVKMLTGFLPLGRRCARPQAEHARCEAVARSQTSAGVIPEDLATFDNLTAEYLTFVGRIHLMPRDGFAAAATNCSRCWRQDEEKKLTLEYSHGMKKLAIAAALLPNRSVVSRARPFEGVDAVRRRDSRRAGGVRLPRVDDFPDVARAGNRRAALHTRGDHRQGATRRAGRTRNDPPRGSEPLSAHAGPITATHKLNWPGSCLVNWQHLRAFLAAWRLSAASGARRADQRGTTRLSWAAGVAIPMFVGSLMLGMHIFPRRIMHGTDGLAWRSFSSG